MSRSTCPHLQTIVQINPAELCIQKKVSVVKIDGHLEFQKREKDCIIAAQTRLKATTTDGRTDGRKFFIQFATYGHKIIISSSTHRKTMKVYLFLSCFFAGEPLWKLQRAWTQSLDMFTQTVPAYRMQRQTQRPQHAPL